jgi:hypothetical protein
LFDTRWGGYGTEEVFFVSLLIDLLRFITNNLSNFSGVAQWIHEFGGLPWEKKAIQTAEKYNPALFVENWTSPHLIVSVHYITPTA